MVVNAEFDLEFLKRLLDRTEIVNIGIRNIIRLAKEAIRTSANNFLRKFFASFSIFFSKGILISN